MARFRSPYVPEPGWSRRWQLARYFLRLGDREIEAELEETAEGPRVNIDGEWRPVGLRQIGNTPRYLLTLNDRVIEVLIAEGSQQVTIDIGGHRYEVHTNRRGRRRVEETNEFVDGKWLLRSPLTGVVNEVRKQAGDVVSQDEVLLVIEAMKMLNELRAGVAGRVSALHVEAGSRVELGMPLVELSER